MHRSSGRELSRAIVGSGQYLAFTPCHHRPVRIPEAEIEPRNAVCCQMDGRCWGVSFVRDGADWHAVWTPLTSQLNTAPSATGAPA